MRRREAGPRGYFIQVIHMRVLGEGYWPRFTTSTKRIKKITAKLYNICRGSNSRKDSKNTQKTTAKGLESLRLKNRNNIIRQQNDFHNEKIL